MEVFFKCLHCNDVYLCEKCESFHPRTHLMVKVSTPFHWTQPKIALAPTYAIHTGICSVCASSLAKSFISAPNATTTKYVPAVVVPDNELYDAEQRGNNPRWVSCDGKGSKCMRKCTGINWKCLVCDDYDMCEACERSREFSCRSYYGNRNTHDMTHPLLKVLDSRFDESKWILSCNCVFILLADRERVVARSFQVATTDDAEFRSNVMHGPRASPTTIVTSSNLADQITEQCGSDLLGAIGFWENRNCR
ncbi:hypothetical protein Pelo_7412 [Pelomyxa schiedti]|nr:hypothetical protein Pelo_7412 [Pelomyxa schiedti]